MSAIHTFAGGPLDRAGHRRTDAEWISAKLKDPSTRIVPLWKLQPLVTPVAMASAGYPLSSWRAT